MTYKKTHQVNKVQENGVGASSSVSRNDTRTPRGLFNPMASNSGRSSEDYLKVVVLWVRRLRYQPAECGSTLKTQQRSKNTAGYIWKLLGTLSSYRAFVQDFVREADLLYELIQVKGNHTAPPLFKMHWCSKTLKFGANPSTCDATHF